MGSRGEIVSSEKVELRFEHPSSGLTQLIPT